MTKQFPYLEVSGTYEDLGRAIGEKFAPYIQKAIERRKKNNSNYAELITNTESYIAETKKSFLHIFIEMQEIAKAARVPLEDYVLLNTPELFEGAGDHCTTVVSRGENGYILGHNEDWEGGFVDGIYILKACIEGVAIIGLNYVSELPGTSITLNSYGLTNAINHIPQKNGVGVSRNVLAHAILFSPTLSEAKQVLIETKKASGFNHVLVQDAVICDVEVTSFGVHSDEIQNEVLIHTNHILDEEIMSYGLLPSKSSLARYARARSLAKVSMTEKEVISLLSDKENPQLPICRHDATVGSVLVYPTKKLMKICYGPPCQGEFVEYRI